MRVSEFLVKIKFKSKQVNLKDGKEAEKKRDSCTWFFNIKNKIKKTENQDIILKVVELRESLLIYFLLKKIKLSLKIIKKKYKF